MSEPDFTRTDLAPPWRSFVVIDTETNGLDDGEKAVADPRVVELAAVRFDMGVPTRRAHAIVRTGVPIPADASAIHGVTDERCEAEGVSIADAWGRVLALYDEPTDCTVAYNGAFDFRFLNRDVKRARGEGVAIPTPPPALRPPWLDVLVWVRHEAIDKFVRGQGRHKLAATCTRHGIELAKAHSAEADALACGQLWLALRPKVIACADARSVAGLLRVQTALAEQQERDFKAWLARQPKTKPEAA